MKRLRGPHLFLAASSLVLVGAIVVRAARFVPADPAEAIGSTVTGDEIRAHVVLAPPDPTMPGPAVIGATRMTISCSRSTPSRAQSMRPRGKGAPHPADGQHRGLLLGDPLGHGGCLRLPVREYISAHRARPRRDPGAAARADPLPAPRRRRGRRPRPRLRVRRRAHRAGVRGLRGRPPRDGRDGAVVGDVHARRDHCCPRRPPARCRRGADVRRSRRVRGRRRLVAHGNVLPLRSRQPATAARFLDHRYGPYHPVSRAPGPRRRHPHQRLRL